MLAFDAFADVFRYARYYADVEFCYYAHYCCRYATPRRCPTEEARDDEAQSDAMPPRRCRYAMPLCRY